MQAVSEHHRSVEGIDPPRFGHFPQRAAVASWAIWWRCFAVSSSARALPSVFPPRCLAVST